MEHTGLKGKEAKIGHSELYRMSSKLRFLNCPLEMIERQWGGTESVNLGLYYLNRLVAESKKDSPNINEIYRDCKSDLNIYRTKSSNNTIRSRKIENEELAQISQGPEQLADQNLNNLILSSINQPTRCYMQRAAGMAGYLVTMSAGVAEFECYTPLGRRFLMRGPSWGIGVGVIAAYTLPNFDQLNKATYKMLLYKQKEQKRVNMTKFINHSVLGPGVAFEHDFARAFRQRTDGQTFLYDARADVGLGIASEMVNFVLVKKDITPLYLELSKAIDLKNMAERI